MRRLMTGYAVTFNKRHKRNGHLFQNRYKSVVCEEDAYLLELIRYIHLNPLRASLVQNLQELDKYPWSGHSSIFGRRKNPLVLKKPKQSNRAHKGNEQEQCLAEKTVEEVLLHFGETKRVARRRYRDFVKKGTDQGSREDLQGGGLVRSAGGETAGLLGRQEEEREKGDARILGSGDFVIQTLDRANEVFERSVNSTISFDELIRRVTRDRKVDSKDLLSSRRTQEISNTRAIISYLTAIELKNSGKKIASHLRLSEKSVSRCIERGKKLLDKDEKLLDYLQ